MDEVEKLTLCSLAKEKNDPPEDPEAWDCDGLLTPQVFEANGTYYMLYAGLKGREWQSGLAAAVRQGDHFVKSPTSTYSSSTISFILDSPRELGSKATGRWTHCTRNDVDGLAKRG